MKKLLVEQAIPGILHAEMRMNEKVFWSLLAMVLDRYQESRKDSTARKDLIAAVEAYIQEHVHSQWKFPLKDSGKQVDP